MNGHASSKDYVDEAVLCHLVTGPRTVKQISIELQISMFSAHKSIHRLIDRRRAQRIPEISCLLGHSPAMTELHVTKSLAGWIPADDEAREVHAKQKLGALCAADFKQVRNSRFLRKYFALLKLAFDYWETGDEKWRGQQVAKNFERFRSDVQILAGYGEPVWAITGDMRVMSKSISFAKMDEETFNKLYQSVLTVLLDRVMKAKGFTRETIEETVNHLLDFA